MHAFSDCGISEWFDSYSLTELISIEATEYGLIVLIEMIFRKNPAKELHEEAEHSILIALKPDTTALDAQKEVACLNSNILNGTISDDRIRNRNQTKKANSKL